ncbi:MAG: hypothetical protein HGB00_10720 [Chlorobiaceae bacterium]|nr:hypothetical protein [Chlorobiaceae bacterium]
MNSGMPNPEQGSSNTKQIEAMTTELIDCGTLNAPRSPGRWPNLFQERVKKMINRLLHSPATRKPLTEEEQIIAGLAEQHSSIFLS